MIRPPGLLCLSSLVLFGLASVSCISLSMAEEYYALGTAYFDLKKYGEAETWYGKSKFHRRTRSASEYNLGRIAYAVGRYDEAAGHFERVLARDPENVTALKAVAYTFVKTGNFVKAEEYYSRVLSLVPEGYDEGYNYALVLTAMDRNQEAEAVLIKYNITDSADALFLLALARKKQGKPEAADTFRASILKKPSPRVRFEYGEFLEEQEQFAKALEEYRLALGGASQDGPAPSLIKFRMAAALIKGDSVSTEGITLLQEALNEGFLDKEAMEALLTSPKIPAAKKEELRKMLETYIQGGSKIKK
ncbi:MAG: tetratricopeptide repeat protein [Treponema sp.]|jgi:tetratricopeptide (TPR) repeat protein|nr:tetratricopeptide repeat protein [Treponema sp.]